MVAVSEKRGKAQRDNSRETTEDVAVENER